jgi:hypothetical protein
MGTYWGEPQPKAEYRLLWEAVAYALIQTQYNTLAEMSAHQRLSKRASKEKVG